MARCWPRAWATLPAHRVLEVRCRGLWAGLDVDPGFATGRELCERLMAAGVLAKDAHGSTIRLAPPLVVTAEQVEMLVQALAGALSS